MAFSKSVIIHKINKEFNAEKKPLLFDEFASDDSDAKDQSCSPKHNSKLGSATHEQHLFEKDPTSTAGLDINPHLRFFPDHSNHCGSKWTPQSRSSTSKYGKKNFNGKCNDYGGTSDVEEQCTKTLALSTNHSMERKKEIRFDQSVVASVHCHDRDFLNEKALREKRKRKIAMKKLVVASVLSCLFMIGEIVGGYFASSLAVMTDASHLLTDVSSFLISLLALRMAAKPKSKKLTFGWHRAEVISALISVLAIWLVTGVLIYLAALRIINKNYNVNGKDMLITAGSAVVFNIVMGVVLHEHGHAPGHSRRHETDSESTGTSFDKDLSTTSEESGNVNVRAAFIHVLGDLLQSFGVLAAAFIIYFKPQYKIADPICTFLFSIFVLITTLTILRDAVMIIMEGSPLNVDYKKVEEILLRVEEVVAVHDLRLWSLTVDQNVMSAHLVIYAQSSSNIVLKKVTSSLRSFHDFHSITLQIEHYSSDMDSCEMCKPTL